MPQNNLLKSSAVFAISITLYHVPGTSRHRPVMSSYCYGPPIKVCLRLAIQITNILPAEFAVEFVIRGDSSLPQYHMAKNAVLAARYPVVSGREWCVAGSGWTLRLNLGPFFRPHMPHLTNEVARFSGKSPTCRRRTRRLSVSVWLISLVRLSKNKTKRR